MQLGINRSGTVLDIGGMDGFFGTHFFEKGAFACLHLLK